MKCCVATCHVSTAWHLLLKARVEVGLRPQCSAPCGGPEWHGQSEQRLHPGRNKPGPSTFQQAIDHQCGTAFYSMTDEILTCQKIFKTKIISERQGRSTTLNEYRPRWHSVPSRRIPGLAVNNAICPSEKTLVYPSSPSCSQSANILPRSRTCFHPEAGQFPFWGFPQVPQGRSKQHLSYIASMYPRCPQTYDPSQLTESHRKS